MNCVKKIILFISLFMVSGTIVAQRDNVPNLRFLDSYAYHFGYLLGYNQMFFKVKIKPGYEDVWYKDAGSLDETPVAGADSVRLFGVENVYGPGFNIGIVGHMRLGEHFDLRSTPSLSFGNRSIQYLLAYNDENKVAKTYYVSKTISSIFVDVPLMLRYKGDRINNVRPFVAGGVKYAFDINSNAKKKKSSNVTQLVINRHDMYGIISCGFDFYTVYFKLGTELSMSYGLFDMLKRDQTVYTQPIEKLNSKIFQFSITFE